MPRAACVAVMGEPRVAEPPSGLGNFKGVMLCTRPDEGGRPADAGPPPFRSATHPSFNEQMGLNPPAREPSAARAEPRNVALGRHCQWLKQLQVEMRDARENAADDMNARGKQMAACRAFCEDARSKVREMRAQAEEAKQAEIKAAKAADAKPAAKPKWAMTEKAAQDFDEDQTVELLDFVDALNFDEYIEDLEFRKVLEAVKGRAGKLDKEQDAFKQLIAEQFNDADDDVAEAGDDAASNATGNSGVRRQRAQQDASVASEAPSMASVTSVASEAKSLADRILKENSDIRSVHSAASVARIMEKQKAEKELAA